MAYETTNAPSLIAQRVGAALGNLWMYVDGDDQGTVGASGYISNGEELGMKNGDVVMHIDTANGVTNTMVVEDHTKGTASGATCSAIEPVGETSIALSSAGTGTIVEDDIITFGTDTTEYRVTAGDADVSGGGTLTITPALVVATAVGTAITVKSGVKKLRGQSTSGAIVLDEARTLTAAQSGSTIYLSLAGGFATTLPAPAEGLKFKFVAAVAPTTAYTIVTSGSANIIHGQISSAEDAAGSVSTTASADTISFVANKAIKGDYCEVESDGTSWYVSGMCNVQDGMTTTQAS